MPIIGVLDSAKTGRLWPANSYESIATVTASGSTSTLSFTSIPQTYAHLQIRGLTNDATGYSLNMTFNSDTTANYSIHQLYGNGSAVAAFGAANFSYLFAGVAGYSTSTLVAPTLMDILDYTNTNKNKTVRFITGFNSNGATTGYIQMNSGAWRSNSAITRIDLSMTGNFSSTATYGLYGIKVVP
jgi:hypothetical protein